jgi:serine/threonine protein kinase
LAPGSIIAGRYRLVALLGRGGMGDVYRADDLTLDQPIALKFLPEYEVASGSESHPSDFLLQALLLARAVGGAFHGSSGHGCFG